jgi:hypothetical protein
MDRNVFFWAVLAFIVVAVATPFELFGIPLALVAAILFGGIAGWFATRSPLEGAAVSGAKAGAIVGLSALLGSIVGLAVLAYYFGNIPEVQAFVQSSEPDPAARIPSEWIAPLGALAGVVVGLVLGVFDLVLSALAGWIAGAIHGQNQPVRT